MFDDPSESMMPRRHRAGKRRQISGAQQVDLWLGPTCHRDHRMFGGVWCPCSPWPSPIDRERGFWSLPPDERRHLVALYDYDERFRSATEEAEASGRDVVLVEIERGLLEPAELATLVSIGAVKVDPVLLERADAASKALQAGRYAGS
jgi:hypothetical protein